ncbi:MAG: aminopeptidase P N-terminal domain-containing protein [Bdellovibrionota bacterium]
MQPINYRNRLEKVADRLGSEALLVLAQPEAVRNSDVGHSYRQESFLYYLTGLDEANSALLVVPREKDGVRFIAFVAPSDPVKELWEGRMIGVDGAKTKLAVDEAFPIAELWTQLVQYLKGHTAINYCLGRNADADRSLVDALTKVKRARPRYFDYKMPIVDSDKISPEILSESTLAKLRE